MAKPENSAEAEVVPLGDEEDESSQIRRLPSVLRGQRPRHRRAQTSQPRASAWEARDTQPCAPPAGTSVEPFNLERTLRFARLLRETLPPTEDVTRLLDLAIVRRDAVLLRSLMRHLYQIQQQAVSAEAAKSAAPATRRRRTTLLPPAPTHPLPEIDFKRKR